VFNELLRKRISPIVELSSTQISQLEQHYNLLIKWNKVLNLTSLHKVDEIVERHYCESIFLGVHLPSGVWSIGDVGSGAGFPGIPVAVMRSECEVSLIESHQRKSVFLREATRDLSNVEVVTKRIEDVGREFDWLLCRAVRFSEIEKPASAISTRIAILGTEQPVNSCFKWNTPVQLPWGRQRYLWLGNRSFT
jgi:16S rRNA (guanine527-N7)-methyltransferase